MGMADKYEAFVHYGPYDKETIDAMYNVPSSNVKEFEVNKDYAMTKLIAANFETIAKQID